MSKWMEDHVDLAWKIIFFNLSLVVVLQILSLIVILVRHYE